VRALALLLCGAISYVVIADVFLAKCFASIEVKESSFSTNFESVDIFDIPINSDPFTFIYDICHIAVAEEFFMRNHMKLSGSDVHISGARYFSGFCDVGIRRAIDDIKICGNNDLVGRRLSEIANVDHGVRIESLRPIWHSAGFYRNVCAQLPFGGILHVLGLPQRRHPELASRPPQGKCESAKHDSRQSGKGPLVLVGKMTDAPGVQVNPSLIDFKKIEENGNTFVNGLIVFGLLALVYAIGKFLGLVDYKDDKASRKHPEDRPK